MSRRRRDSITVITIGIKSYLTCTSIKKNITYSSFNRRHLVRHLVIFLTFLKTSGTFRAAYLPECSVLSQGVFGQL